MVLKRVILQQILLPFRHQAEVGLQNTEAWRLWELEQLSFQSGSPLHHQSLTLTRSRGCVQHAAPQDANPPKYHRDTRLSAMVPRGAVKPRSCSRARHVSSPHSGRSL